MFKKLVTFLMVLCALPAISQSHTLPTLDRNNNWTGVNTFVPGNLRLGSTNLTCAGSQVMTGFSFQFVPICGSQLTGVSSLNGLTGGVTLAAGTNIGLVPSGNTITISSTAAGVTNVNSITGAVTLAAGANITVTPSGNTITIAGTGGGVSSVNALTGAVVFAAGANITLTPSGNTVTIAAAGGGGGSGVTALNGGTGALTLVGGTNISITPSGSNITIADTGTAGGVTALNTLTGSVTLAAGANVTLTPSGNTVTIASTGGGGGGSLNTLTNDMLTNSAGNTPQDMFNFYANSVYSPQTAITAAANNGGLATLLPSSAGTVFNNNNNTLVKDDAHQGAEHVPVTSFGAICDTRHTFVSTTASSTLLTIGGDFFFSYDIGKVVTIVSTVGGVPTAYEGKITAMGAGGGPGYATAVVDTPVPFTASQVVNLGHDDTAAFNEGFIWAQAYGGSLTTRTPTVALTIPAGTCMVHALNYNGASIQGLGPTSTVQGMPGENVFAFPDPSTGTPATAGLALIANFSITVDDRIDSTLPWQITNVGGTTSKTPVYVPAGLLSAASDNPLAPGWFQGSGAQHTGAIAGVGAINSGTPTLMTVPAGVTLPTASQKIVFPYLTTVFTTTVSSVNIGTRVVTLGGSYPGSTGSQIEWWAGTTPQNLAVSVSSGACPASITVTLPNTPNPSAPFNVATFGLIQIDSEQFTYTNRTNAGAGVPSTYTFRIGACAQNGTTRAAHSIGATIVPLNQFKPATPWPVTPTINSNATTPVNAAFYPAWNIGATAWWAGQSNGATTSGVGSFTDATIENIWIGGGQRATNSAAFYMVSLPYNAKFRNITVFGTQYGIMEGVPAFNAGGQWAASQPTGDGTSWEGIRLTVCNVFDFIAGSQNSLKDFNTYSNCLNSAGSAVGAHTAWYLSYGWNDYSGGVISGAGKWQAIDMYHEGEFGPDYGRDVQYEFECNDCLWDDMHMGSGGENHIGGHNQHWRGGNFNNLGSLPSINYGVGNTADYGTIMIAGGPLSSTYGASGFIDWGTNSNWLGQLGGVNSPFGPVSVGIGNGRQPMPSQTNEAWNNGNVNAMYASSDAGFIPASEFNTSFSWEAQAFNVPWFYDSSLLPDGSIAGGAVGCSLSGTLTNNCFSYRFNQNGIYVGPNQRIAAGKYTMYIASKSTGAASSYQLSLGVCSPGNIGSYTIPVTSSYTITPIQVDLTTQGGCSAGIGLGFGFANAADTLYVAYVDFAPVGAQPTYNNVNLLNHILLNGSAGTAGQCLQSGGTGGPNVWGACTGGGGGGGSVTSVGLTALAWLTVTNSPITTSGNIALASASVAQNLVLASPNGSSGALSPRALVPGDIPAGLAYLTGLSGDVVATGSGVVASTVNNIGGGTLLSTFTGLLQNNAGTVVQANTFSLTGSGQVGTRYTDGVNIVAFTATPVFDFSLGDTQQITLTADVTSSTFANPPASGFSQVVRFIICQDGTGGHKFVWPTAIQGVTPVTMTASQCTSEFFNVTNSLVIADNYNTENCISSASPAVCDKATIGEIAIPTGTNPTLQINTTSWTAHSQIIFTPDATKGADLSVTCNTNVPLPFQVTTAVANTSVTLTFYGTISTNPLCGTFSIRNP